MKTLLYYHGEKFSKFPIGKDVIIINREWQANTLLSFISEYKGKFNDLIILLGAPVTENEDLDCETLLSEIEGIVIGYPEISFFFERVDDTEAKEKRCLISIDHLKDHFGFISDERYKKSLEFIIVDKPAEHLNKLISYSNLFDASNIRYFFKVMKFRKLNLTPNYRTFMSSRASSLATVIDEEYIMANRIAYSLFASGYRSLSISSEILLNEIKCIISKEEGIVLRDFDLQMPDAIPGETSFTYEKNREAKLNNVDILRGYKLIDDKNNKKEKRWICLSPQMTVFKENSNKSFEMFCQSNSYWYLLKDINVYCVSHGYEQMIIDSGGKKPSWTISNSDRELHVPGFQKPVVGIYHSINTAIRETVPVVENLRKEKSGMKHSRENHDHSVPLDLYGIVVPMLTRAESYYEKGEYILAAVLSQECIEILNGMHATLSNKAILIHAKAENAIAMNDIGGNEKLLAMDCERRIEFIKTDIVRLNEGFASSNVRDDTTNILNQIFSDCRQYCHEKEHFLSEDVFIDAMAKLNDGLDLIKPIQNFISKLLVKIKH